MTVALNSTQVGDYDLKSRDIVERGIDVLFASVKFYKSGWGPNICYDSIACTTAKFDKDFPGWQFYRRVRHGDPRFDRTLEAFAIGGARGLARAGKENGRRYVSGATCRKRGWIAQAGRDALDYAIFGKFPAGLNDRAQHFGVHWKTYQAIRDPLAGGLFIGVETWASQLHSEFTALARWRYSRGGDIA
jgi:hypothetical protein